MTRFQTRFAAESINLLDQRFACFIAWMGFACKMNCTGRVASFTGVSSFLVAEQSTPRL
jgi:hypothetical protein